MVEGISIEEALGSAYDQAISDNPELEETEPQVEVETPAPITPVVTEQPEPEQSVPTKLSDLFKGKPKGTPEPTDKRMVPLSDGTFVDEVELVAGYMRQSDYTKKTTELAEQRKDPTVSAALELAEQLKSDPVKTVAELARRLEIIDDDRYKDALNFSQRPQSFNPAVKSAPAFSEDKIAEMVAQKAKEAFDQYKANDPAIQELELQRAQAQLGRAFKNIETDYGDTLDEDDRNAIVQKAIEMNDPNLEYVYLKLKSELAAFTAGVERVKTATPKKSTGAGGAKNQTPTPIAKTFEEAWQLAELSAG